MTTSDDPDQIRADIERTRARLSADVDTLTDTANPANIAHRQADKVKGAVRSVRDSIMGAPDDPADDGRLGDARSAVADAPGTAKQKTVRATRGNPVAAGLIAFGAGLLVSSLIPASQREQQAVSGLQENLEPMKQQAGEVAKEMADNLRGPAEDAVSSVRATATEAAENVQSEGQSATTELQDRAEQSATAVRDAHAERS